MTDAAKTVWKIRQGRTWRQAYQWVRNGVAVAELANATDVIAEIRDGAIDDTGSLIQRLSVSGGEIEITSTVQAATPVTTAFAADGLVVATGATYIDDKGSPLLRVRRTLADGTVAPGDQVTIAGSTSNDGTFEALEVVDANTVRVDTTFTAEPQVGTVQVDRDGEMVLTLTAGQTDALTFPAGNRGVAEVYIVFPTETVAFIDGKRVRFIKKVAA